MEVTLNTQEKKINFLPKVSSLHKQLHKNKLCFLGSSLKRSEQEIKHQIESLIRKVLKGNMGSFKDQERWHLSKNNECKKK